MEYIHENLVKSIQQRLCLHVSKSLLRLGIDRFLLLGFFFFFLFHDERVLHKSPSLLRSILLHKQHFLVVSERCLHGRYPAYACTGEFRQRSFYYNESILLYNAVSCYYYIGLDSYALLTILFDRKQHLRFCRQQSTRRLYAIRALHGFSSCAMTTFLSVSKSTKKLMRQLPILAQEWQSCWATSVGKWETNKPQQ